MPVRSAIVGERDRLSLLAASSVAGGLDVGRGCSSGLVDEGVEAGEEFAVPVGFVDPASLFGVVGEGGGVDALRGQDCDRGGVGDEVGAVFADVGVGAGALGWCSQAVPAGEAGLDDRGVTPVVVGAASAAATSGSGW